MPKIDKLVGREVLDSRGTPTVEATCFLEGCFSSSASVPSGASTGSAEAFELRNGDARRYGGYGCRLAASNVSTAINHAFAGRIFTSQEDLDAALIALDGSPNKRRLGANAILAVSLAFARACAQRAQVPLYSHFATLLGKSIETLPRLTINLFSGGKHAGQQVSIQDLLMIPMSAQTVDEALVAASDVYHTAAELMFERYGMRLLTADEGGLAPPFRNVEEMFTLALDAIERAHYRAGADFFLGVDAASSHFYREGSYHVDSRTLTSEQMITTISSWVSRFPVLSVEDGLAENDWENWPKLREAIAGRALTVGDDLLCTNPARIQCAAENRACNTLLLKVNQIGTLTEALASYRQARSAGWSVVLSVRSGETEDDWAADLAAGWSADQFKGGSIRQSERLSKYNRLLTIADETNCKLAPWPDTAGQRQITSAARGSP